MSHMSISGSQLSKCPSRPYDTANDLFSILSRLKHRWEWWLASPIPVVRVVPGPATEKARARILERRQELMWHYLHLDSGESARITLQQWQEPRAGAPQR